MIEEMYAKCVFAGDAKGVMIQLMNMCFGDGRCELACRPKKGAHYTRWPRKMYSDRNAGMEAFQSLSDYICCGGVPEAWFLEQSDTYTLVGEP